MMLKDSQCLECVARRLFAFLSVVVLMSFNLGAVDAATGPSGFTDTLVVNGLSNPTAMAFAPDGRLFVCQQGGALRVIKNGGFISHRFVAVPGVALVDPAL